MSERFCQVSVEIDANKFIDNICESVHLDMKNSETQTPEERVLKEALQITHHILDCMIKVFQNGKDDMKFCALLSRGLNLSGGWTESATEEMVNRLMKKSDLSENEKRIAKDLLKKLIA